MQSDSKLSKAERETTIIFTEADDFATIETYNRRLIKRLDKLATEHKDFYVMERFKGMGVYQVPKKHINISKPRRINSYHKQMAGKIGAEALEKYRFELKKGQK